MVISATTTPCKRCASAARISLLRYGAALYFRYDGPYAGSGPYRRYSDKLDYDNIPVRYLKATKTEYEIRTDIYRAEMLHKEFAQALECRYRRQDKPDNW